MAALAVLDEVNFVKIFFTRKFCCCMLLILVYGIWGKLKVFLAMTNFLLGYELDQNYQILPKNAHTADQHEGCSSKVPFQRQKSITLCSQNKPLSTPSYSKISQSK